MGLQQKIKLLNKTELKKLATTATQLPGQVSGYSFITVALFSGLFFIPVEFQMSNLWSFHLTHWIAGGLFIERIFHYGKMVSSEKYRDFSLSEKDIGLSHLIHDLRKIHLRRKALRALRRAEHVDCWETVALAGGKPHEP